MNKGLVLNITSDELLVHQDQSKERRYYDLKKSQNKNEKLICFKYV